MSNWSEILTEVNQSFPTNIDLLNKKRKEYMDKIAEITGRNVITYYSGWLKILMLHLFQSMIQT